MMLGDSFQLSPRVRGYFEIIPSLWGKHRVTVGNSPLMRKEIMKMLYDVRG
jgi:hypothetical protein